MVADEPSPEELEQLIAQAREVRERAWSPYSGFRVGAALLSDDGRIFTGCNVENASLGLTICAERAAVAKAVSEGATSFRCVVIVTGEESPSFPSQGMDRLRFRFYGVCRLDRFDSQKYPTLWESFKRPL